MRQTFYVAHLTSMDARGDDTFGTPTAYACRYEPSSRTYRNQDGFDVAASGIIYTTAMVATSDCFWPPGADHTNANESFRPIRVDKHYDPDTGQLVMCAVSF
jgi:hypothetical protein